MCGIVKQVCVCTHEDMGQDGQMITLVCREVSSYQNILAYLDLRICALV